MSREEKEQIARSAASEWCHCFKCDGIVNDTGLKCEKPGGACLKWYDGYRTAMIALGKTKVTIEGSELYHRRVAVIDPKTRKEVRDKMDEKK